MALNLQDKQAIVAEVREVAKTALSMVIVDFRGITVDKMTELRKEGNKIGIYIKVIRNTLMRRIIKNTCFECLKDEFIGPTLIALSDKNPGAAARLFKSFTKKNIKFTIKSSAFQGIIIPASQIDKLENIPTYDEAIVRLILTIKEFSTGKLIRTLIALRNKKETAQLPI